MSIEVAWQRLRLEPPIQGRCEDPECVTLSLGLTAPLQVATYLEGGNVARVCAPCDERRLRAAIEEDDA